MPIFSRLWSGAALATLFLNTMAAASPAADPDLASVTTQPADRTVAVGGGANFAPIVYSAIPVTYRWLFNGSPVPDATNLNLTVSDCQRTNSGWYVLQADNDAGRIATAPAHLTVEGSPAGTIQFRNVGLSGARINAASGGTVSGTTIELFAGTEPDLVLPTGVIASVNNGYFFGDTISFPSVAPSQTLFVRARLGNGRFSNLFPVRTGYDIAGGTLDDLRFPTIDWPSPVFLEQPQDADPNLGGPLTLRVSIHAYSLVRVYWIKDGSRAPVHESTLELGSQTAVEGTATFSVPAVTREDAGNYKALLEVGNGSGYAVSDEVNVRVVIPAAGRLDPIKTVGNRLQIGGGGRANRVYTLESKTPPAGWVSRDSKSSPTGAFTFPPLNPPTDPTWFRLRSSN